jgi:hypothetical protein
MSVARHHADWLNLVETSGPFLSMPVLMRVFPQGLDQLDPGKAKELRLAYDDWQENPGAPGRHRAWVGLVLNRVLEFPSTLITEGQAIPAGLQAVMAEYGETLNPDVAIIAPAGQADSGTPRLLVQIHPPDQDLDSPVAGKHWKASPATRMTELLHVSGVPLGLVTNGEQWMLVFAPRGETTGYASWYAALWQEEQITLRAFRSLMQVRRFFGVATEDTLDALLRESAQDQQEVTNQLGYQVRHAVEVLVQAFDRLDQDSGRKLLTGISETMLYDAALTVMMRLVFLFCAEERHIFFPSANDIYDECYAASTLRERLREIADQSGEELLERSYDAWARLLATFRAIHGGVEHENMRLIAYGGTLFDPDRYPFLEGRKPSTCWRESPGEPLAINNRVVLHLLESLQMLQVKVPGGGPAEARRLSFRGLDIEQIGHVYEGLLDHTAVRSAGVVLGLRGTRDKEPEVPLERLEELRAAGEDKLLEFLNEETGRSESALKKALSSANGVPEQPALVTSAQAAKSKSAARSVAMNKQNGSISDHAFLIACGQDVRLMQRLKPFVGLIREDDFSQPMVILPGCVYVTEGTTRRSTGTHYTPRILTEPIVQHTLEPLVYDGPAEGRPKETWCLKSAKDILSLRICDMTMGSAAFLVQACRYLSERLVEAWENAEKLQPGAFIVTPEGDLSVGAPSELLLPKDATERLAIARRVVADRSLFGVDINPMAVEMAKLSLWLITMQRDRPFSFLDHALKCGDSLLGICRLKQLETFSLDDAQAKQVLILSNYDELIRSAIAKRRELEMLPSNAAEQIAIKNVLHAEAEELLIRLKLASDLLVSAELAEGSEQQKEMARAGAHLKVTEYIRKPLEEFRRFVRERLDGWRPFHWPLEFPEVFARGGFDAFVGNPPFVGGLRITGVLGTEYRNYLITQIARGKHGIADLCAYFFLRAFSSLRSGRGFAGLLATSTIAQGDTREVGLDQINASGGAIFRAVQSAPWPGDAALEVAHVWLRCGPWRGECVLNSEPVREITAYLTELTAVSGKPFRLTENANKSFIGSYVHGTGFVLTTEEAQALIANNLRNREVLFPYLIGDDINSRPDQSPSRWAINFFDWPIERAKEYPECFAILREKVFPERQKNPNKQRRELWWRFTRPTFELYSTVQPLSRFLIHPLTSKYNSLVFSGHGVIASHMTVVLAFQDWANYALLQSDIHWDWVLVHGNKLETRPQYTPSDVFETFPFPSSFNLQSLTLLRIGEHYYESRRRLMLARQEGLTKTYNHFHDPGDKSLDIARLRALHVEMDQAVAAAYGWSDLDLGHDFRQTKQGVRFTIGEQARHIILDRLLELNHKRYEEELNAGLHEKKNKTAGSNTIRQSKDAGSVTDNSLFE